MPFWIRRLFSSQSLVSLHDIIFLYEKPLKANGLSLYPCGVAGYRSIAHEGKPNGLLTRGLEGEGSNCFSITQLVGQKKQ